MWVPLQNLRDQLDDAEYKWRETAVLDKLAVHYRPEIVGVFEERGATPPHNSFVRIVHEGLRRALEMKNKWPEKRLHEHVKQCVADALDEHIAGWDEWFYGAKPEELLFLLSRVPHHTAEMLVGYTTFEQAKGLLSLLVWQRTGGRGVFYSVALEREPIDDLDRITRSVFLRLVHDPAVRRVAEGPAKQGRTVILALGVNGPTKTKNKGCEPLDYAGPLHAKSLLRLRRELNKHGNSIKDPESRPKIAQALKESPKSVRRYLKADIPITLTPDGRGSVYTELTPDAVFRAMEIAKGKQRGPRSNR